MSDEYICKVCGHRAGNHLINNICEDCDCKDDPYLEQLLILQEKLKGMELAYSSMVLQSENLQSKLDIAVEALKKIRGRAYPNGLPTSILANETLEKLEE